MARRHRQSSYHRIADWHRRTRVECASFILGLRFLGGWRFFVRTIVKILLYSLLMVVLAEAGVHSVTRDVVLNTLYGAIIGGVGMGLVFRAKSTTGGTDVLTQLLSRWRGIPLSVSYPITDAIVILLAGLIFDWEKALYALIALYVTGLIAEAIAEGVGITRLVRYRKCMAKVSSNLNAIDLQVKDNPPRC